MARSFSAILTASDHEFVFSDAGRQVRFLVAGFARARCSGRGYDFLVAFSCKGRGVLN